MTISVLMACLGCFIVGYAIGLWFSEPVIYKTEVKLDQEALDELNRQALELFEGECGENGEEDGQEATSKE